MARPQNASFEHTYCLTAFLCNHQRKYVGFEVHTPVIMNCTVFWVVMQCSSETVRSFEEKYRLHLLGRRVTKAKQKKKAEAGGKLS
jgi:hypothetical protein